MQSLYHLIVPTDLNVLETSQVYEPDSLVTDGFIHLAYKNQLAFIIKQFFVPSLLEKGVLNTSEALQEVALYLVEIDRVKLTAKVVNEPPVGLSPDRGASPEPTDNREHSLERDKSPEPIESLQPIESPELYPHLYGGLNREAIVKISPLKINAQGDYAI